MLLTEFDIDVGLDLYVLNLCTVIQCPVTYEALELADSNRLALDAQYA